MNTPRIATLLPLMARLNALRDYQLQTLGGLLTAIPACPGATFTVMFPRQAGKNQVAAVLVACLLRIHALNGGEVVVCAPTYTPQARISLDRVRRVLTATDPWFSECGATRVRDHTISVGAASAIFLGASPEAHVAGHTASLALIADEAQEIDADWFNRQFRPMAASTGAPAVLFGTPWDGHTLLEQAVAANRAGDALMHGEPYSDWLPFHHEVGWREVAAARSRYGLYVEHERNRLGATHPLFLSQYELRTVESVGRLLTPGQLALIEGTHARLRSPVAGDRYVAGLDFGGESERADRTVLTVARVVTGGRCEVVEHVAWRSAEFDAVLGEVSAIARHWRLERLCVDATGLGAPLASRLAHDLGSRLERVVFTAATKSEMGYSLVAAANTGTLALYADDGSIDAGACRDELRECGATLRGHTRLEWGARRGHDDYVVSLGLCLRAAQSIGERRVAVGHAADR